MAPQHTSTTAVKELASPEGGRVTAVRFVLTGRGQTAGRRGVVWQLARPFALMVHHTPWTASFPREHVPPAEERRLAVGFNVRILTVGTLQTRVGQGTTRSRHVGCGEAAGMGGRVEGPVAAPVVGVDGGGAALVVQCASPVRVGVHPVLCTPAQREALAQRP